MKQLSILTSKFLYFGLILALLFGMGFIGLYLAVGPGLPEVESIRKIRLQTPMRVYSKDHQLIAEFGETRRIPITLDQVPENFINALLSTEDQRFYEHSGVDLLGVLRAFANLAITRTKSQGASTITMLVARNYYLSRAKRFSRKITEMFLAWKIESELEKDEILELFLNKIHFSHHAYGLGAASQIYYGTTLDKLSLAKLATLAGIPKGESEYNPISNPTKARARRAHVLGRMLTEKHITQEEYNQAIAEPIETQKHGVWSTVDAPYLAEMVRTEIIRRFGIDAAYNDGLRIYTTLDPTLQGFAQQALIDGLEEYDRRHGYRGPEAQHNITIDPDTDLTDTDLIEQQLKKVPRIGHLLSAIVTEVDDEQGIAYIQLKDKKSGLLKLKDIKWARSYVDENYRGKAIKKVSQVVTAGDQIRVKEQKNNTDEPTSYLLAQVPEATAGFVALAPDNGAIEALVGGYDSRLKKFNMVTQASRQLGSNIKPFIYSAAFAKQYTPASIINDMPIVEADITAENIWRPKNDGDNYLGPTSLRTGLRRSRNTVSIRLIREIGPQYAKSYLENIGFPGDKMPPYLSLALGSASFTPLEVATGYAVLANGGYQVEPWFIDRVEDGNGRILQQHQPLQVCRECEAIIKQRASEKSAQEAISNTAVADEENTPVDLLITEQQNELAGVISTAEFRNLPILPVQEELIAPRVIDERIRYLINDILKDVIHKGTATPTLQNSRSNLLRRNDIAGKTGTTNDAKDAWFSGYNNRHVATTWVGFEDHNKKLGVREFGGRAALPIWQKFMEKALKGMRQLDHPRPQGIVSVKIDQETGLLASLQTKKPIFELFRTENAPTTYAEKPIEDIFNHEEESIEDDSLF